MKQILFSLFGFLFSLHLVGQLENQIFQDSSFYSIHKKNRLGLEFSPFFRNNEYFEASQDGQTYIGYQLQGLAFVKISEKAELHLGALATQNYGSHNGFSKVNPIASLQYHHKSATFIAGTLKGASHHQLIEPLYQIERNYTDRNENGFQYINQGENYFMDAWIDWEENTNRDIARLESFTVGLNLNHRYQLSNKTLPADQGSRTSNLSPNIQLLYKHSGPSNGASSLPLRTVVNSAIGMEYRFTVNNLLKWKVSSYLLDYRDLSISPSLSFLDGFGHYHNVQFSPNKKWDFMLNYWEGTEWQSSIGGAIYQAVNPFDRRFPTRKKSLLFARVHYHQMLNEKLMIDIRFDPYYDLNLNVLEPSYSLHLRYIGLFL
jgi:hypothetical protein